MAIERERLFGTDLKLLDLAPGLDLTDRAGDLATALGNDNIFQALVLRLRVRRGELAALGWPDFGSRLHELIGQPNIRRTHVVLMAHARTAILQDPRVAGITRIEARVLTGERNAVRLEMEIELIRENTPLNFVFDVGLGAA